MLPLPTRSPALILTFLGLVPAGASAQAWTAEKGSLSYYASYVNNWNTKHYLFDGSEVDSGHTRSQAVSLGLSFALTDRLTLSAALPYVQARYKGSQPHPGTIDNGDTHGTVQDLRLEVRYQALAHPFALTPYVATTQPTHDYTALGHAAPGRQLEEYVVGFYAGKSLDPWIPQTYLQARYAYSFIEKVAGVSHDRSNADLEIGHFLTSQLGVRALASWQGAHGGTSLPIARSHPLFPYHDQLSAESFLNLGVGLSYSLTHTMDIYGAYAWGIRGRNGHKLDDGLSMGVSFSCHCAFRQVGEHIPQIRPGRP